MLDTGSDIPDSAAEEGTGLSNIMVEGSILREPTRILTCCGFRGVTIEPVTVKGGWSKHTGTTCAGRELHPELGDGATDALPGGQGACDRLSG